MIRLLLASVLVLAAGFASRGETNVTFDAGGDFFIREDFTERLPGLPGCATAPYRGERAANMHRMRFRTRVWARAEAGPFGLYTRLVHEAREYFDDTRDKPHSKRGFDFPDELIVDNLYVYGNGIFDGFFDFRIGRQDLFEGRDSVFGLRRLLADGASFCGSRSCYADMIRLTFHPTETGKLDVFGIYDAAHNYLSWGNDQARHRANNAYHPGDDDGMDEWGAGLVWSDDFKAFESSANVRVPYRVYAIHKGNTPYERFNGEHIGEKHLGTFGVWMKPQLTETFAVELEGAQEVGHSDEHGQEEGTMGYAALEWREKRVGWTPYAIGSVYYLSENWDPLWARYPNDSDLFQFGPLPALGYWTNMIFTKLTLGADFGKHHSLSLSSGPMWAAKDDGYGHADGEGDGRYKGLLTVASYTFPIFEWERVELFGLLVGEYLAPGDYYDSDEGGWYARWMFTLVF